MTLHRIRLLPRSPWRTPWHADTLTGMLCVTAARGRGADWLHAQLIEPMLAGEPPFVLSDACPGDWLPLPMVLRLQDLSDPSQRKALKQARWLHRQDFLDARIGRHPPIDHWLPDPFHHEPRRHNTLSRYNDASLQEGGLFTCEEFVYSTPPGSEAPPSLTLYAWVADPNALDLLLDLLHELSLSGFGTDTATGRGQFSLVDEPSPDPELADFPPQANALISLSTFQPARNDPTEGAWEAFPRFGKLAPDLAVSDVRKHTFILLRPGACFQSNAPRPFLGHALPMVQILPKVTCDDLRSRNIDLIHPAFGLVVPALLAFDQQQQSCFVSTVP
jgi:CRISPR-associated protein Csm4